MWNWSLSAACIKEWSKKHGVRVLTEEHNDGPQTADTITHEYHYLDAAKDACMVIIIWAEVA
jgi:hypothetical protein